MIRTLGFLDVSSVVAYYVAKYRKDMVDGVLWLRNTPPHDPLEPVEDLPILKEWRSAKAVLSRIRAAAAPFFDGTTPELGKAWLEALPPMAGTPWTVEDGEYADAHVRTRTCIIPCPQALTHCGAVSSNLLVGVVNLIDHRQLCSDVNFGEHTRVHLIVDVRRPDETVET